MSSSSLLNPLQCLQGIREVYFDNVNEEDEVETETDPDEVRRVSLVEEHLLELLKKDESLDMEEVKERERRASFLSPPPPADVLSQNKMEHSKHAYPCDDTFKALPAHPSQWPQAPLMIRPTPHTSTEIRGIRRVASLDYEHFRGFCAGCILPINCGNEAAGDSFVIDFESSHFIGTLLMRIMQAPQNINDTVYTDKSYFDGKKRKFQAVVKGKFKTGLPMVECVTGQIFNRPAGKLPAQWIVTTFIKFISTLAPQLEAQLDGNEPRFLTPLVATAQTVLHKPYKGNVRITDMEEEIEEPASTEETSLLPLVENALGKDAATDTQQYSLAARMKARKKAMNNLVSKKDKCESLTFSTDMEYTFEFYQHLLDFGETLAVDMGRPIGKVGLAQATDGQPLKFMSAHKDPVTGELDSLWSFDIWHSSLYPYAELASKRTGS